MLGSLYISPQHKQPPPIALQSIEAEMINSQAGCWLNLAPECHASAAAPPPPPPHWEQSRHGSEGDRSRSVSVIALLRLPHDPFYQFTGGFCARRFSPLNVILPWAMPPRRGMEKKKKVYKHFAREEEQFYSLWMLLFSFLLFFWPLIFSLLDYSPWKTTL